METVRVGVAALVFRRVGRMGEFALAAVVALMIQFAPVAVAAAPTVSLDPTDGPPGTAVSWVVRGFGDCAPVDDAVPGGVVALVWDGVDELGRAGVVDGSAESTFVIPESASLEVHRVSARCTSGGAVATNHFAVKRPEEVPVVVPNVVGDSGGRALKRLVGAGLVQGRTTGDGNRVTSQDPGAGTRVDPRSPVDLVFGAVAPVLVEVPNLVNGSLEDARRALDSTGLRLGSVSGDSSGLVRDQSPVAGERVTRGTVVSVSIAGRPTRLVKVPNLFGTAAKDVPTVLASRGLVLGVVSGRGRVVRKQSPTAGTRVKPGSTVDISVERRVAPVRVVRVPDLEGMSPARAEATLSGAGLVLGGNHDDGREVASQDPAAGTLVPIGSTVTATYTSPTTWVAIAGSLAAAVTLSAAAGQLLKRRLDRRWARVHVRVAAGEVPGGVEINDVTEDPSRPTPVVRIEPHHDSGIHHMEEVEP